MDMSDYVRFSNQELNHLILSGMFLALAVPMMLLLEFGVCVARGQRSSFRWKRFWLVLCGSLVAGSSVVALYASWRNSAGFALETMLDVNASAIVNRYCDAVNLHASPAEIDRRAEVMHRVVLAGNWMTLTGEERAPKKGEECSADLRPMYFGKVMDKALERTGATVLWATRILWASIGLLLAIALFDGSGVLELWRAVRRPRRGAGNA